MTRKESVQYKKDDRDSHIGTSRCMWTTLTLALFTPVLASVSGDLIMIDQPKPIAVYAWY